MLTILPSIRDCVAKFGLTPCLESLSELIARRALTEPNGVSRAQLDWAAERLIEIALTLKDSKP
jgi:hypothetical protein